MTQTKPSSKVCATCPSGHGERRFNARTGWVELNPDGAKVVSPAP